MSDLRNIGAALLLSLLAASCGTDAVDNSTEGVVDPSISAGSGPAASSVPFDHVGLAPSAEFADSVEAIYEQLQLAQSVCADAQDWSSAGHAAADDLEALASEISEQTESGELADWVSSSDARTLTEALESLVVDAPVCVSPASEPSETDTRLALETAGRLSGALDTFRGAATQPPNRANVSRFWMTTDEFAHARNLLRARNAGKSFPIAIVGSSVALQGFDPGEVATGTGRPAINIAMNGLYPNTIGVWLAEASHLGLAPDTLVVATASFEFFGSCDDQRKNQYLTTQRRRASAFSNIETLAATYPAERIIGGPDESNVGTARDAVQEDFGVSEIGTFAAKDTVDPLIAPTQQLFYERDFAAPALCESHYEALAQLGREATAAGTNVIFVAMPISEAMTNLHPEGRAGHEMAIERHESTAAEVGAIFLDLSLLLDAQQFSDLTHAARDGRAAITDELLTALQ